jgi:hypothetical protein
MTKSIEGFVKIHFIRHCIRYVGPFHIPMLSSL